MQKMPPLVDETGLNRILMQVYRHVKGLNTVMTMKNILNYWEMKFMSCLNNGVVLMELNMI